jgi:hypothetical protein
VYLGSNDGYLYAVRPNGTLAWRTKIGASVASTPAVRADGSIVVGVATLAGASAPGRMICLNPSGTQRWFYDGFDVVDSSPAIGPDNRIYFTDYARRLHALNDTSALATNSPWPKWRRESTHKARMPNDGSLGQLTNLSTRAQVGTGGDILIAGTYVGGGAGKTVLVRGVGPELAPYLSGVLADPVLEVYDANDAKIFENDDWDAAIAPVFPQVGAFNLDAGSLSAAMLANLAADRRFTFQIKGEAGSTGVALVEIYDAQETSGRLVNLSSRAVVGTGVNVLIPGFYVKGTGPLTLLIRAVGPTLSLPEYGVPVALQQPLIMLIKNGSSIGWNQTWGTAHNEAFNKDDAPRVGAYALPYGRAETSNHVTEEPGLYSFVV